MSIPVRRHGGRLQVMLDGESWQTWNDAERPSEVIRFDAVQQMKLANDVADFVEKEERKAHYAGNGVKRRLIMSIDVDDVTDELPDGAVEQWFMTGATEHFHQSYPASPLRVRRVRVLDNGLGDE